MDKNECVIVIFGLKGQHKVKPLNQTLSQLVAVNSSFFIIFVRFSKKAEYGY